ncbi:phage tail-collar fiber domain-containing protein [Shewanella algae]|uniref:phage tail-collar fiber domain-containing protein n=1 Tax=Shewanella algae TaxID=38313 RepID=UPI001C58C9B2|nr:phage tail protein [Shewanella algae]
MATVITKAGEALMARKAQANEQLDIDTFIFANVPGQDPAAPIDRDEGVPPVALQVHQQQVQQYGRISDNIVVYSTVLSSTTGPFEFNWLGLYSSVNQTLVAIQHVPTVTKTVTAPGVAGNTLNRNFGIEYSGIAELTGINVAPETWQLDFTARLAGMDELTRQLAADMNGRDWFIGDGFKVEPRSTLNSFRVLPGVGYVSGLRIELENEHIFNVQSYPQNVYVDAWFDGTAESVWRPNVAFTVSNTEMDDYIDVNGVQHYVFKLAVLSSASDVDDLRNTNGLIGKAVRTINTVNNMKETIDLTDGTLVRTKGYIYAGDGGGAEYLITSSGLSLNNRTIIELKNGLKAIMQSQGSANLEQANVSVDDVDIGLSIQSLMQVGVRTIHIKNKRVKFNGTIDLNGSTVIGNNSVYTGGNLINGTLIGISKEALSNKFVKSVTKVQPVTTKSRNKILVKCDSTPYGVSSPLNELYCILSPSSYGGVSMFFIGNGVGDDSEVSFGQPFDRLRVWNTFLANNGVICKKPDSTTGTIVESDYEYLDKRYKGSINTRWSPTPGTSLKALNMSAGATARFIIPAGKDISNVAFYTSPGSTDDATIKVNGQLVKNFSAKDNGNKIKHVTFEIPATTGEDNQIDISAGSGTLYLYGIDVFLLSEIPSNAIDSVFKYNSKLIVHSFTEMTYSGVGASIDTVVVDSFGKFIGSYHGGDLADYAGCEIRVGLSQIICSTSSSAVIDPSKTINKGEFLIDRSIRVRYVGKIKTNPELRFRYSLDFGIDGGCNVTAWYLAENGDVSFKTIFTAMHSTSRKLLLTPKRNFNAEATGETVEMTTNELPLYQYGTLNNQLFIVPSESTEEKSTILGRLWDDVNYLKFYYTPVAMTDPYVATLENGNEFSFSCLYQYGRAII